MRGGSSWVFASEPILAGCYDTNQLPDPPRSAPARFFIMLRFFAILGLVMLWSIGARGQGYSPEISAEKMTVAPGLEVKLVASEPLIRQPVAIEFDDRGRLWVIQYLQYPNPAGLSRVDVDRFSRTKYDRIPEPPPKGPKGADRITILEDTDGDGRMDRSKDFVSGLNLASSIAFGRGGVFVLQVPYLLFYPDRNRDDIPDSDPEVLLTGFGMEDAHSVANSLTWGPDGWLYGLQGSTVTARIRGVEFQQGVWRYHPETRKFELYAEGGGNMWGLDFNREGECFASTNVGGNVMLHAVQGGYYWKSFGKHGPLHNPYTFGYFDHVKHEGVKGGHVSVGGLFYESDVFPAEWKGRYIAADLLGHAIHWHDVQPLGSTYRARQGGDLLVANDTWFAPSDLTLGPDGCLYVTDWHDRRTAHPDPDADWDRTNGRIYKIQPKGLQPRKSVDLDGLNSSGLVDRLGSSNQWEVLRVRRILGERKDRSVEGKLLAAIQTCGGRIPCIEALWALNVVGGFTPKVAREALIHPDPSVRAGATRLVGDHPEWSSELRDVLARRAAQEPVTRNRSLLAGLAQCLEVDTAEPILVKLSRRSEDATDPMVPLRIWWSIEHHLTRLPIADRFARFDLWSDSSVTIFHREVAPRLIRRYVADGLPEGLTQSLQNIIKTGYMDHKKRLARALEEATRGRSLVQQAEAIEKLTQGWPGWQHDPTVVRLIARSGNSEALAIASQRAADSQASESLRIEMIRILGECSLPDSVEILLKLAIGGTTPALRSAAFDALEPRQDPRVVRDLLNRYPSLDEIGKKRVRALLSRRSADASRLLAEVDSGRILPADFSIDEVRQLALVGNDKDGSGIKNLIRKHWGLLSEATPEAKLAEVRRLNNDLRDGVGNKERGRALFKENCAGCHRLFNEGNQIGPELTHANRKDRDFLLVSLVAPSDLIRKEYRSTVVHTKDGRVLTGLMGEQTPTQVVLIKSVDEKVTINKDKIELLVDSPTSLMPEDLYRKFNPGALRDLFSYLQSDQR